MMAILCPLMKPFILIFNQPRILKKTMYKDYKFMIYLTHENQKTIRINQKYTKHHLRISKSNSQVCI